jgi:hypothetical protein
MRAPKRLQRLAPLLAVKTGAERERVAETIKKILAEYAAATKQGAA